MIAVKEIKGLLNDMGNKCHNLADKVTESGGNLLPHEKDLLRIAIIPKLKDIFQDVIYGFIADQEGKVGDSLSALKKYMNII